MPSTILRRWPPVTTLAAVVAWSIGLLPSSIPGIPWSSPVTWLVAAALGLVLVVSLPTAQFMLLRKAIHTAGWWIPINAAGWLLGISWTFAVSPLVNPSTPTVALIMIYAMAGVLMAATVAVVTGLCWMQWMKRGSVRIRAPRA